MSRFNHNIAFIVPESLWPVAGAIVAIISNNEADVAGFSSPAFAPDYAAKNHQATDQHAAVLRAVAAGQMQLPAPSFAVDMAAVHAACVDATYVLNGIPEDGLNLSLSGDSIIIGLDVSAADLAAACGFVVIESPQE
jgi:hypothetical protein